MQHSDNFKGERRVQAVHIEATVERITIDQEDAQITWRRIQAVEKSETKVKGGGGGG